MDADADRSELKQIALVTPDGVCYQLGGTPYQPTEATVDPARSDRAAPARSLANEAMRWTYVLRSRERWRNYGNAVAQHAQSALATLYGFGLADDTVQEIARAGSVMVQMPFVSEEQGWAGRIFPWEFVIANATRRYRGPQRLTVFRYLAVKDQPGQPVPRLEPRVLFVQSQPGALLSLLDIEREAALVRDALAVADDRDGRLKQGARMRVLKSPTLTELEQLVRDFKPEIVHFAGCDAHQGVRLLRDNAGARSALAVGVREPNGFVEVRTTAAECLERRDFAVDGVLLRSADGTPRVTLPDELGAALTARGTHLPYLVSLNVWNSAARIAPLLLSHGVLAAIGFQDVFDDTLAEFFYQTLYQRFDAAARNLPAAFEGAWAATREQLDLGPGTGVALWGRAPLVGVAALAPAPERRDLSIVPVSCEPKPKQELNYSVLHNSGALFDEFVLLNHRHPQKQTVDVLVELHCGSEKARYASRVELAQERWPLHDKIRIPLTATLMRTVSEAMLSTLYVKVQHGERVVVRETYPLRLLPVDQWLDNARSGQWLPSFVLPRDPAVESAIGAAQRYVRAIRDDPAAGFEGYQSADAGDPDSLDQVDLQVESIWAALLHEWQLGYINPPPTYADIEGGLKALDSQRLRTPSAVQRTRMGTCIDLALLFAACLELVDIYPVVFLLKGHALPGYWRHADFQDRWRKVGDAGGGADAGDRPADQQHNPTPGAQLVPWKVGESGWPELWKEIRTGRLVPLETVRLTEHCGFRDAVDAGIEALRERADFDSVLDIVTARRSNVTPLPIIGERP